MLSILVLRISYETGHFMNFRSFSFLSKSDVPPMCFLSLRGRCAHIAGAPGTSAKAQAPHTGTGHRHTFKSKFKNYYLGL